MGFTLAPAVSSQNVPLEQSGIDWTVCRTVEQLGPLVKELYDQFVYAWDVETGGRTPYAGKRIIGHSFAWRRPSGQIAAFYAPCRHRPCGMDLFDDQTQIEPEKLSEMLKPALEGPAVKRGHNISFDIQFARFDGINVAKPASDTLLAFRVYNENLRSYRLEQCLLHTEVPFQHGWKAVVEEELKRIARFLKVKIGWLKEQHGHEYVPIAVEGRYGCQDAAYEFMLGEFLEARNFWPDTLALEQELLWVCLDIQRVGVPLDSSALEQLREFCRQEMQDLAPRIWTAAGEEFQITNDTDLRRILFSKLGLPVVKETHGGARGDKKPSVDDDSLWALETQHGCALAGLVRRYNSHSKIYSTYSTSIVDLVDPHGILHGEVRQFGAKTGRCAMAQPNLQNIPTRTPLGRRVKAAFCARPGMVRYCLDYCLTGDTEVLTIAGPLPMRDVVKFQPRVLSCSPDGQLAFKEVERSAKIGRKKVVDLELDDGSRVRCTADHQWMKYDGSLWRTEDLKPGDRLRHVRQGRAGRYPTWWWRNNREYWYCHRCEVDHLDNDPSNWSSGNLVYKTIRENRGEAAGNWWRTATPEQQAEKTRQLVEGQRGRRSYDGDGNPNYGKRKGPLIVCAGCGQGFYRPPSHRAKYCSHQCYCADRRGNNFKVVAVHPVGVRTVYHLTVADWHTFVLGNGLVSGNSQIELRVLAHLSQDPTLLRIYHEGLDAHRTTAIEAFGTADKVNGVDMRRVAKILNFGVSFGMTEVGLMGNINKDLPEGMPPIDEAQAKEFLTGFYRQYAGIVRYRDRLFYDLRNQRCEFTNLFGRPRRIPILAHKSDAVRRKGERQAISTMVQGTAADIVKRCMLATWRYLRSQTDCEAYLVLMVHDDLQFDMAPDGSARTIREIKRLMEETCQPKFSVPIKVDVEYFTTNWNEKKGMTL